MRASLNEQKSRAENGGKLAYVVVVETPWLGAGRARRKLALGTVSKRDARRFLEKVEALVSEKLGHAERNKETAAWVAKLDPKKRQRLEAFGLLEPLEPKAKKAEPTVGYLLDEFWRLCLTTQKPQTLVAYGNVKRELLEHFGADRPLAELTEKDALEWRAWLATKLNHNGKVHADATVSRRVTFAKQLFRKAVSLGLVTRSVFADLTAGSQVNKDRLEKVPLEHVRRVLDVCPNQTWRTLLALARFAALRTPSESLSLRWDDVQWEAGTLTVLAQKTGQERQVPLSPELRRELEAQHLEAEDGAEFVVNLHDGRSGRAKGQSPSVNLRTQLLRLVKRAGLPKWDRLWHNLRATRVSEWADEYGYETAAAFSGHTVPVLLAHYKQRSRSLDAHYAAAQKTTLGEGPKRKRSQKRSQTALDTGS